MTSMRRFRTFAHDSRSAQIEHTGHYLGQSPGVRLAASQERAVIHSNFAGCTAASGGAEPHEMIALWLEFATIWLAADPVCINLVAEIRTGGKFRYYRGDE